MAIIGKIRSKSRWIVGILGLALLAFTFDLWKDLIFGSSMEEIVVGKINDEEIKNVEFDPYKKFMNDEFIYKNGRAPQGREIDENNDKAWIRYTDSILISKECEELSIEVGENELEAITNGTMDMNKALSFYDEETRIKIGNLVQLKKQNNPQYESVIKFLETDLKFKQLQNKYLQIVKQGIYVSKLEVEDAVKNNTLVKNLTYVKRAYNEIPDDRVQVSDKEIKTYYKNHKDEPEYRNFNDVRTLSYVQIPIVPSAEDTLFYVNRIKNKMELWKKAESDSIFIREYSLRHKCYNDYREIAINENDPKSFFYGTKTFRLQDKDKFFDVPEGSIIGPYYTDGLINISKVIGYKNSGMKIKRVFLGDTYNSDSIQLIFENAKNLNFDETVRRYSKDPEEIKKNNGILKIKQNETVDTDVLNTADLVNILKLDGKFANFCDTLTLNRVDTIRTSKGLSIVQVTMRNQDLLPILLTYSEHFKPSKNTIEQAQINYSKILQNIQKKVEKKPNPEKRNELQGLGIVKDIFIINDKINYTQNQNLYGFMNKFNLNEQFNAITTENLIENAYSSDNLGKINQLENPDKQWQLFYVDSSDEKSNTVIIENPCLIVTMLSDIKKKGSKPLNEVRDDIKLRVRNEKKGKYLAGEMVDKELESTPSISISVSSAYDFMMQLDPPRSELYKAEKIFNSLKFTPNHEQQNKMFEIESARDNFINMSNIFSTQAEPYLKMKDKLLGIIYSGLKDGETSLPVIAYDGVYIFRVNKTEEKRSEISFDEGKYEIFLDMQNINWNNVMMEALRKKSNLKDNRVFVELGINP